MPYELPGFVDAHCHLVRASAGVRPPYDYTDPSSIAAWHRSVAAAGSTPMDQPPEPLPSGDLASAVERGLRRAAGLGLVEIHEAGMVDPRHLDALRSLRERGPLPVRVRVFMASGVAGDGTGMRRLADPWLEVVGVKFYADGWLGPRTCALSHPFEDRPGDDGVLFLDADALSRRIAPIAEGGWTIATHAIGDRAIATVLDAYERVFGDDCAAAAPRIEHAQVLRPDLVSRMAELGVVACIQPSFAVSDAEAAASGLGERAGHAYRWSALLVAGVRVISGSDYPIETLSPLRGLQHLVTGMAGSGPAVAPTLPLADALAVMTDERAGTTVLGADPMTVAPDALGQIAVAGTKPAPT